MNGNGIADDDNETGDADNYATLKANQAKALADKEIADDNLAVLTNARDALQLTIDVDAEEVLDDDGEVVTPATVAGSEQIELTRLLALKTAAETNYSTVEGALAHANVVLQDGQTDLEAIQNGTDSAESVSLASLNDALAVATYLHGLAVVDRDAQQAISDLNTNGGTETVEGVDTIKPSLVELTNLRDLALATNTRAQKSVTFYNTVYELAASAKDFSDE